jgi:two-component system NtrC family sensor kinase
LAMVGAQQAEEKIGLKCTDLLCSLEEDKCPLNSALGASFSNEIHLRSTSEINPVVLRKAVALSLNGKRMVLETFVDITACKHDEQAAIEKHNYINKILDAATVGILVVDGTDFTIVEANPAALTMIGAPREMVLGSHCHRWIRTQTTDECPVTSLGDGMDNAESELKTVQDGYVPIVKNVSMTMLDGRLHLVESFIDITRLKAAEEEARRLNDELEQRVIERTAQFEKSNQDLKNALQDLKQTQSRLVQSEKMASVGQLAAGVAHEINNPVGFVKSNLHAIDNYRKDLIRLIQSYEALTACLNNSARQDDDQVRQYLDAVDDIKQDIDFNYIMDDFEDVITESDEGLMRVAKIVADLKNFAHMKSDEAEWMDINAGIESTLNIVWNELKYKAEVAKELGPLPLVRCYPQRINQVVMNLLVNAGQAIREKGRISIKTRAVNGYVIIEVHDTGEGIAHEDLNKIFDPFFTTKEVGKGTGLGLNVVYNIIKSHKGRIDVDSTPGQGSTFTLHLPLEPDLEVGKPCFDLLT